MTSSEPLAGSVLDAPVPVPSPESAAPALPDAPAPAPLPTEVSVNALQRESMERLGELAVLLGVRNQPPRARHPLVGELVRAFLARGVRVTADGILELGADQFGFVRWPEFNFLPCPEDLYVPAALVRQYGLRAGQRLVGTLRPARDKEKYTALDRLTTVEDVPAAQWTAPKHFDQLTPMFPNQRIILECPEYTSATTRAIDLIATLGRGQRGLILAPPRVGKTVILKHIARGIRASNPDIHLLLLLVDERPEEVTDFKRELPGAEIFSSTFDESPTRHIQVAEMVGARAHRLVETGKHVVILMDSITRLARGYNAMQPTKGKLMSGGLDSKALIKPKKLFSGARNTEEGGSLTILATALVDTGSRADEVIFEEFKGTGNMELHLDRELVEKRIYPAIHILKSGTRREELLYHPDEFERVQLIRKQLAALPPLEGMEVLLENLNATKSNLELLLGGLKS